MALLDPYHIIIMSMKAAGELEGVFEYIAKESPETAPKFIAKILTAIEGLKLFPLRQVVQRQTKSRNPIRSLPFQNYMIFYRVVEKTRVVRIVRIAHGARRRPKRFR